MVAARTQHRPHLNVVDVPELLPGARPGASSALREQFEDQCRKLHRDEEKDEVAAADIDSAVVESFAAADDLEAMFPTVEPALIRDLIADASSTEHAVELLLALSASTCEESYRDRASVHSERPVDANQFPVLVSSDGWQVASKRQLERGEEDLGSAWCDLAKDVADLPMSQPRRPKVQVAAPQHASSDKQAETVKASATEPQTEYELRWETGQRRMERRSRFGRRVGLSERGRNASEVVSDSSDVETSGSP